MQIVVLSREAGPRQLNRKDLTAETVGQKAFGLAQVPEVWVPRFCCVAVDWFPDLLLAQTSSRVRNVVAAAIAATLDMVDWSADTPLYVRSSGVSEGVSERGQYSSEETTARTVVPTL